MCRTHSELTHIRAGAVPLGAVPLGAVPVGAVPAGGQSVVRTSSTWVTSVDPTMRETW
jgi:hypothetical protein